MAKDPGGFFSLSPCFWFCCLRKRARPADDDSRASSRSRSFSYSESSSDDDEYDNKIVNDQTGYGANEDDKIAADKAGYGATEDAKLTKGVNGGEGVVGEPMPSWNEIAEDYSIASPDLGSSDEEEGEAITKPLESLTIVSEQIIDEDEQDQNSDLSSSPSIGEIHVIGDSETYSSLTNVSASREQLMTKVGDTSSLHSWSIHREDSMASQAERASLRSQQGDTASMKSWVSRTSKSPSVKSMQAETSSLKSWSKEETISLDRQPIKRKISNADSIVLSTSASLEDITEAPSAAEVGEDITQETSLIEELPHDNPAAEQPCDSPATTKEPCDSPVTTEPEEPIYSVPNVEGKQVADPEPVNVQPIPSIEIDSVSPTLQPKESIKSKNSDDSGVVVEKFNSLPSHYKSQSAVFSDDGDAISLQSATSTTSIDATGLPKKKKKKLKLFKKFHFKKKKKKNKLLAQQEAGYSVSTPILLGDDADAMSSNMSANSKSRYSASLLLASLDDLSDEDICKD